MLLFVGLGNPGTGYAGHRHNVGFMALDAIAARHGISPWRRRFQGVATEGSIGSDRVLLLKPGTYMNESGRAVAEAARFYKIAPHDTLVFHDEIDLAPGKVRAKLGGGTAGHNGLRSISAHIGNDYRRVRIGVGHPGDNASLLAQGEDASFQNKVHLAMAAKGFVEPKRSGAPANETGGPT